MPVALKHKKIIRKSDKKIHRFQSDRFGRVAPNWRKPKGIDNPLRRHYKGYGACPTIGYGTDRKTRYMDKHSGFTRVVIHNESELKALLMHNRRYSAVIAGTVGARKKKDLVQLAREMDVYVVNSRSKLKTEESE